MKVAITPGLQMSADRHKHIYGEYPEWYQVIKADEGKSKAKPAPATKQESQSPRPARPPRPRKDYEAELLRQIRLTGLPEPQTQYRWWSGRKFAADFAYPELKILIEIQGGIFQKSDENGDGGRHNQGAGYQADRAKYNEAQLQGWTVFEFGPTHVTNGAAIEVIRRALQGKQNESQAEAA